MLDYGFLNINKPKGITSFDVIHQLRKITGIRKIGHTGTLDPFATGVLLIGVGKATRFISLFTDDIKSYTATAQLGLKTNTGDYTGRITMEAPIPIITSALLSEMKDKIMSLREQKPPNFSAIKINGKRAYELARKEQITDIPSRPIRVFNIDIIDFKSPYLTYSCTVSKGTYIRSLSETIGEMLGTIATTIDLSRTRVGEVDESSSITLDMLDSNNWRQFLLPIEVILRDMKQILLNETEARLFVTGIVQDNREEVDGMYLVCLANQLLGLGENIQGNLHPRRVIQ